MISCEKHVPRFASRLTLICGLWTKFHNNIKFPILILGSRSLTRRQGYLQFYFFIPMQRFPAYKVKISLPNVVVILLGEVLSFNFCMEYRMKIIQKRLSILIHQCMAQFSCSKEFIVEIHWTEISEIFVVNHLLCNRNYQ